MRAAAHVRNLDSFFSSFLPGSLFAPGFLGGRYTCLFTALSSHARETISNCYVDDRFFPLAGARGGRKKSLRIAEHR